MSNGPNGCSQRTAYLQCACACATEVAAGASGLPASSAAAGAAALEEAAVSRHAPVDKGDHECVISLAAKGLLLHCIRCPHAAAASRCFAGTCWASVQLIAARLFAKLQVISTNPVARFFRRCFQFLSSARQDRSRSLQEARRLRGLKHSPAARRCSSRSAEELLMAAAILYESLHPSADRDLLCSTQQPGVKGMREVANGLYRVSAQGHACSSAVAMQPDHIGANPKPRMAINGRYNVLGEASCQLKCSSTGQCHLRD